MIYGPASEHCSTQSPHSNASTSSPMLDTAQFDRNAASCRDNALDSPPFASIMRHVGAIRSRVRCARYYPIPSRIINARPSILRGIGIVLVAPYLEIGGV